MLKGYYIHVHLDFLIPEQSLRSAIQSLPFLQICPIESILIRPSRIGFPLLTIPTSTQDTKENTTEIAKIKRDDCWVECCCHLREEPKLVQGVVIQLTTDQYRSLVLEFKDSRPLFVKGRVTDLEDILCQEKRYSLFDMDAITNYPFSLRTLSMTLQRRYDPIVLTAGVLSLMTWIEETFQSLDPTILAEQRSRVYFWVGESRIGKTILSQTLVKDYEYSRGGINWQEYQGLSLQVYDDLNFSEETIAQNLKTLFNTSDEGSIRRVYGITRIKRSAVLVLLNADTFISLKDQIASSHLQDWIEKNSILYPFENNWDPDSDTISDSQLVYGKGTPSRFGEGIVLDRDEKDTPPRLSIDPLFKSLGELFSEIRKDSSPSSSLCFEEKIRLSWKKYGKGDFPLPQEPCVQESLDIESQQPQSQRTPPPEQETSPSCKEQVEPRKRMKKTKTEKKMKKYVFVNDDSYSYSYSEDDDDDIFLDQKDPYSDSDSN